MRRLLVLAALSTTLLSVPAFALPEAAPSRVEHGGDVRDPNAGLRRTLASVLVIKKLDLTSDQKREILSIITDAKALRAKAVGSVPENERRSTLERAIADARANGEISADTKEQMKAMREKMKAGAGSLKGDREALHARMEKVLTPAQIEKLQAGKHGKGDGERRAHKQAKRAAWVRLMMSDEFAAELAR